MLTSAATIDPLVGGEGPGAPPSQIAPPVGSGWCRRGDRVIRGTIAAALILVVETNGNYKPWPVRRKLLAVCRTETRSETKTRIETIKRILLWGWGGPAA